MLIKTVADKSTSAQAKQKFGHFLLFVDFVGQARHTWAAHCW
jgi:hypothetical protein